VADQIYFEEFQPQVNKVQEAFQIQGGRFSCLVREENDRLFVEGVEAQWEGESLVQKAKAALKDVREVRTHFLGKKGDVASLKRKIGTVIRDRKRVWRC
jgi:hypothetical protein